MIHCGDVNGATDLSLAIRNSHFKQPNLLVDALVEQVRREWWADTGGPGPDPGRELPAPAERDRTFVLWDGGARVRLETPARFCSSINISCTEKGGDQRGFNGLRVIPTRCRILWFDYFSSISLASGGFCVVLRLTERWRIDHMIYQLSNRGNYN